MRRAKKPRFTFPHFEELSLIHSFAHLCIQSPSILVPLADNMLCWFGNGCILSMMEPHLAAIGADSGTIAITFLLFGLVFAVATPVTGMVMDGSSRLSYHLATPSPILTDLWTCAICDSNFAGRESCLNSCADAHRPPALHRHGAYGGANSRHIYLYTLIHTWVEENFYLQWSRQV